MRRRVRDLNWRAALLVSVPAMVSTGFGLYGALAYQGRAVVVVHAFAAGVAAALGVGFGLLILLRRPGGDR